MMLKPDQNSWLIGLKSSDEAVRNRSLEDLYVFTFPKVSHFILQNNGDAEDARDIFQDGMVIFYKQIRNINLQLTCAPSTWVFSICRNLWLKELRNRGKTILIRDNGEFVNIPEDHSPPGIEEAQKGLIQKSFALLTEECKTILKMYYYHRLKLVEILEETRFPSLQVVKNKKAKCLGFLRKQFLAQNISR